MRKAALIARMGADCAALSRIWKDASFLVHYTLTPVPSASAP